MKNRCSYSGHVFENGDIPFIDIEKVTPKEKIKYMATGVVCPGCGRKVAIRNHPMTCTRKMIPMHNKDTK